MKKMKSFLSLIIAVLLVMCCLPVTSFAATRKNYLVLGDSIAYGQGIVNSEAACYGRIVADTNGYNYSNYAVDGLTSGALLTYIGTSSVKNAIKEADIIQISIGGNDFLTSNMFTLVITGFMGINTQYNSIQKSFASNLAKIITKIRSYNSGAKILMQTLYNPCNNNLRSIYQKGVNCINSSIKSYLSSNPGAYTIVDVESAFSGHTDYIAVDTIHPNSKGNLAIAKATLNVLGGKTTPVINNPASDWTSSTQTTNFYSKFNNIANSLANLLNNIFG